MKKIFDLFTLGVKNAKTLPPIRSERPKLNLDAIASIAKANLESVKINSVSAEDSYSIGHFYK